MNENKAKQNKKHVYVLLSLVKKKLNLYNNGQAIVLYTIFN